MKKIYVAGALTDADNLDELEFFYEKIADLCSRLGFYPFVPHLSKKELAPPEQKKLSPPDIFNWDTMHVMSSDLIVAYVGKSSYGVGIELGIASQLGIPVILLSELETKLSPMLRGLPQLVDIVKFENYEQGIVTLGKVFLRITQKTLEA